ncbi:hypothetical protein KIW84_071779 [Lathyrus oleraceus]|uniref:Uncharacterized protein n=1 Tax=Pisum sativum TaxID=3888 RepID=A0A9D4VKE9_PEA|nr:hypothetical protein KIW84_071779 [Pisum sativum]
MDIDPAYSFLLGRPWIHEAGDVTSTLHQKLKFVKNGKLIVVGGEKALLVSHLSSFTYVDAEKEVGTSFQALSIADELKKTRAPMSSLKDAQEAIQAGSINKWGRIAEVADNKNIAGLGFQPGPFNANVKVMQPIFHSGGFIHGNDQHSAAIIEDCDEDEACDNFHEEKAIQPFEKQIELVNLGFDDDVKEVEIGSQLCLEAKKGLVDLLREYSYVFAWSYRDMPGLDSKVVEHRFPLKPECPPVK